MPRYSVSAVMDAPEIYCAMARYNLWMNGNVYEASTTLNDETRKRDLGAPFRSVHGTLNHLLLADRVWMGRFQGRPYTIKTLGDELYADFEELRAAREATDADIEQWAATLTSEQLETTFRYVPATSPQPRTQPFWVCVQHFFNHQTHHRGQLTTLLEQLGMDYGVTDFLQLPGVASL